MPYSTFDAGQEISLPFSFFTRHGNGKTLWPLAITSGIVAGLASLFALFVIMFVTIVPHPSGHQEALIVGVGIVVGCSIVAVQSYATSIALCTAAAAVALQPVDLSRDIRRASARIVPYAGLLLMTMGIAIFFLALCLVVIGLPLLFLLGYALFYAPAAVVIGGESPTRAMATSFRIARAHKIDTLIALLGGMGASFAWLLVFNLISWLPIFNIAICGIAGGYAFTYAEFVRARFYLVLREPGAVTSFSVKIYSAA